MVIPRYPRTVILEPTNRCNMRCRSCHFWGEGVKQRRAIGSADPDMVRAMIDEMVSWNVPLDLMLTGAGEPLLHPQLAEMVSWAARCQGINVGILTNGLLLTPERSRELLEAGIGWIGFSVDGADPERYAWYRGSELGIVEEHIEHLLAMRRNGSPRVFLNMVKIPGSDPEGFVERWHGRVDEVKISTFRPVGSRSILGKWNVAVCPNLFTMMVVSWEGEAVLCCEDIWAEHPVGRFQDESLYGIWHGEALEEARRLHNRYLMERIPLCATCDIPYCSKVTREYHHQRWNCRVVETPAQVSYNFPEAGQGKC